MAEPHAADRLADEIRERFMRGYTPRERGSEPIRISNELRSHASNLQVSDRDLASQMYEEGAIQFPYNPTEWEPYTDELQALSDGYFALNPSAGHDPELRARIVASFRPQAIQNTVWTRNMTPEQTKQFMADFGDRRQQLHDMVRGVESPVEKFRLRQQLRDEMFNYMRDQGWSELAPPPLFQERTIGPQSLTEGAHTTFNREELIAAHNENVYRESVEKERIRRRNLRTPTLTGSLLEATGIWNANQAQNNPWHPLSILSGTEEALFGLARDVVPVLGSRVIQGAGIISRDLFGRLLGIPGTEAAGEAMVRFGHDAAEQNAGAVVWDTFYYDLERIKQGVDNLTFSVFAPAEEKERVRRIAALAGREGYSWRERANYTREEWARIVHEWGSQQPILWDVIMFFDDVLPGRSVFDKPFNELTDEEKSIIANGAGELMAPIIEFSRMGARDVIDFFGVGTTLRAAREAGQMVKASELVVTHKEEFAHLLAAIDNYKHLPQDSAEQMARVKRISSLMEEVEAFNSTGTVGPQLSRIFAGLDDRKQQLLQRIDYLDQDYHAAVDAGMDVAADVYREQRVNLVRQVQNITRQQARRTGRIVDKAQAVLNDSIFAVMNQSSTADIFRMAAEGPRWPTHVYQRLLDIEREMPAIFRNAYNEAVVQAVKSMPHGAPLDIVNLTRRFTDDAVFEYLRKREPGLTRRAASAMLGSMPAAVRSRIERAALSVGKTRAAQIVRATSDAVKRRMWRMVDGMMKVPALRRPAQMLAGTLRNFRLETFSNEYKQFLRRLRATPTLLAHKRSQLRRLIDRDVVHDIYGNQLKLQTNVAKTSRRLMRQWDKLRLTVLRATSDDTERIQRLAHEIMGLEIPRTARGVAEAQAIKGGVPYNVLSNEILLHAYDQRMITRQELMDLLSVERVEAYRNALGEAWNVAYRQGRITRETYMAHQGKYFPHVNPPEELTRADELTGASRLSYRSHFSWKPDEFAFEATQPNGEVIWDSITPHSNPFRIRFKSEEAKGQVGSLISESTLQHYTARDPLAMVIDDARARRITAEHRGAAAHASDIAAGTDPESIARNIQRALTRDVIDSSPELRQFLEVAARKTDGDIMQAASEFFEVQGTNYLSAPVDHYFATRGRQYVGFPLDYKARSPGAHRRARGPDEDVAAELGQRGREAPRGQRRQVRYFATDEERQAFKRQLRESDPDFYRTEDADIDFKDLPEVNPREGVRGVLKYPADDAPFNLVGQYPIDTVLARQWWDNVRFQAAQDLMQNHAFVSSTEKSGFVQLTREEYGNLGALNNQWVPRPVARALKPDQPFFHKGLMLYRQLLLRPFRTVNTVLAPATMLRNFLGNVFKYSFYADCSVLNPANMEHYIAAAQSMLKKDELWKMAVENGWLQTATPMIDSETRGLLNQLINAKEPAEFWLGRWVDRITTLGMAGKARELYNNVDNFFRLAAGRKYLVERAWDPRSMIPRELGRYFPSTVNVPHAVRVLADMPGNPDKFMTFRVSDMFVDANAIMRKPHKYLLYTLAVPAWRNATVAALGLSPSEADMLSSFIARGEPGGPHWRGLLHGLPLSRGPYDGEMIGLNTGPILPGVAESPVIGGYLFGEPFYLGSSTQYYGDHSNLFMQAISRDPTLSAVYRAIANQNPMTGEVIADPQMPLHMNIIKRVASTGLLMKLPLDWRFQYSTPDEDTMGEDRISFGGGRYNRLERIIGGYLRGTEYIDPGLDREMDFWEGVRHDILGMRTISPRSIERSVLFNTDYYRTRISIYEGGEARRIADEYIRRGDIGTAIDVLAATNMPRPQQRDFLNDRLPTELYDAAEVEPREAMPGDEGVYYTAEESVFKRMPIAAQITALRRLAEAPVPDVTYLNYWSIFAQDLILDQTKTDPQGAVTFVWGQDILESYRKARRQESVKEALALFGVAARDIPNRRIENLSEQDMASLQRELNDLMEAMARRPESFMPARVTAALGNRYPVAARQEVPDEFLTRKARVEGFMRWYAERLAERHAKH